MEQRIRIARKARKLTQTEVGQLIGTSVGPVSNAERGLFRISDWFIQSFCRELHVNEHWLRTGEGDMDAADAEDTARMAEQITEALDQSPMFRAVITAYLNLDPAGQASFERFVGEIVRNVERGEPPLASVLREAEENEVQLEGEEKTGAE